MTCQFALPCENPASDLCTSWAFCELHCTCVERREYKRKYNQHYRKKMYLDKFRIAKTTGEQGLAIQIFEGFGKKLRFSKIMGIIKYTGHQATFEAWRESLDKENPVAFFLWRSGENRKQIKFTNQKPPIQDDKSSSGVPAAID